MWGGMWSRASKEFIGDALTVGVIPVHAGQVEFIRWFDRWLGYYQAGGWPPGERAFDVVASGGRRGGKSYDAFVALVGFAIAVPDSICWVIAPSADYFAEPLAYLRRFMRPSWYAELGAPHWCFMLPNGSEIRLLSGHTARRLKQGRCDLALINEGQAVPTQSYQTLSASIVDQGGLVITTANPPDIGDPGEWVADVVAKIEAGDMQYGRHFFFDPYNNPHADHEALDALADKMDEHTFNVQVRGMFLATPDSVLHAWDRTKNERHVPPPDGMRDITREITKRKEGRAFDDVVGVDVQNNPWIAAIRMRFYEDPKHRGSLEHAVLWGVGEAFIEAGDEVECARALLEQGCAHDRTLIITDASCSWQQQQREHSLQRDKYRGGGSMAMFEGEGYTSVVPPDPDMDANPRIVDRVRAANARIGSQSGARRVFVDPRRCEKTAQSIRKWRNVRTTGQPSRHSKHAHGGDAMTYVIWRFYPRRHEIDTVSVTTLKRNGPTVTARSKGFS